MKDRGGVTKYLVITGLILFLAAPAFAVPVMQTFTGSITADNTAFGPNPFGLTVGDAISGNAWWDDSVLSGAGNELIFATGADPALTLDLLDADFEVTLGSFTLRAADQFLFDLVQPTLEFVDGELDGFSLFTQDTDVGGGFLFDFNLNLNAVEIVDFYGDFTEFAGETLLAGVLDLPAGTGGGGGPGQPVPEPGTIILLGSGLVGLAFRRKRS